MEQGPLSLNPELRTPPLPATHVRAGTGHRVLTRNYTTDKVGPPSCEFTRYVRPRVATSWLVSWRRPTPTPWQASGGGPPLKFHETRDNLPLSPNIIIALASEPAIERLTAEHVAHFNQMQTKSFIRFIGCRPGGPSDKQLRQVDRSRFGGHMD